MHGTVVRVGNGSVPNAGCTLKDFVIDGNNLARHLVVADGTYYLYVSNISGYGWRDGYAVVIKHSANVYGAGEKYHTWEHITFVNPYQNGAGIDIAPEGSGNINQINITGCNIGRSNINNSSLPSLRLGYVDHITFNRCVFMPSISAHDWSQAGGQYIRLNPYAITVQPIAGRGGFPNNITFYGTSIYGGINYVDTIDWMQYRPALLFYPFYTADGQTIPPKGYINGSFGTLPSGMVGGFTELGQPLQ